jgi:hypothetical protein
MSEKYKSMSPQAVWQRKHRRKMKAKDFQEVKVDCHRDDAGSIRLYARQLTELRRVRDEE